MGSAMRHIVAVVAVIGAGHDIFLNASSPDEIRSFRRQESSDEPDPVLQAPIEGITRLRTMNLEEQEGESVQLTGGHSRLNAPQPVISTRRQGRVLSRLSLMSANRHSNTAKVYPVLGTGFDEVNSAIFETCLWLFWEQDPLVVFSGRDRRSISVEELVTCVGRREGSTPVTLDDLDDCVSRHEENRVSGSDSEQEVVNKMVNSVEFVSTMRLALESFENVIPRNTRLAFNEIDVKSELTDYNLRPRFLFDDGYPDSPAVVGNDCTDCLGYNWPNPFLYIQRSISERMRASSLRRVIPALDPSLVDLDSLLDRYWDLVRNPTMRVPSSPLLHDRYVSIIRSWGSYINVADEWKFGVLGNKLFELVNSAMSLSPHDSVASEIIITATVVMAEMTEMALQGGNVQNAEQIDIMFDTNEHVVKFCDVKNMQTIMSILEDHHASSWRGRSTLLNPRASNRGATILKYTGLAYANRLCGWMAGHLSLRAVFFAERIQRWAWSNSGTTGSITLSARSSTLAQSLQQLRSLDVEQLLSAPRINMVNMRKVHRSNYNARNMWFATMAKELTEDGNIDLERVPGEDNVFRFRPFDDDIDLSKDYYSLGRFIALSITLQVPIGFGLSENLWKLYMAAPLGDVREHDPHMYISHEFKSRESEVQQGVEDTIYFDPRYSEPTAVGRLCPAGSGNYVSCFLEGFADILPRAMVVSDGILSYTEVNALLIGETYIDPDQLLARFEYVQNPRDIDASNNLINWFASIVRFDLSQPQIKSLARLLTDDNAPIPIGGLRARLGRIVCNVKLESDGDRSPIVVQPGIRTIQLPMYSSRVVFRSKLAETISAFDKEWNL